MKCPHCRTENLSESKFCHRCATPLPSPEGGPSADTRTFEIDFGALRSVGGALFAGRYKIVEELGRGGMGVVFRAYDNQLGEEVALKIIRPEIASEKKALDRFSNELKLARKVIHRNVCRVYELMEHQGTRFISMEYVRGEDLKSFIRRARRLDIGTAAAIAIQVCEGLAEAHRLGVVHRDLKPGNIMIDKEGNAKIMDFGIARSTFEAGLTGEGKMVGTPEYISPEQLDGEPASGPSDLYALAVILFEMVCGTYPFEGDTARVIASKLQGKKPPDPKDLNPHIPDDLAKVILKGLEKKPDRRYGSAAELLEELKRIEKDLPTTERVMVKARSSLLTQITRTFKKRKALGAAVVLAALAVVAGLVLRPAREAEGRKAVPPKAAAAAVKPTLAVFPVANKTNDPSLDVWEWNLATKFIHVLRELAPRGLAVVRESNVYEHLRRSGLEGREYSADDIEKIAALCQATHVLVGKLMKVGEKYQIYYELEGVSGAAGEGAGSRSGAFEDLDVMVAYLADEVLRALQIEPTGKPKAPGSRSGPALQAYAEARMFEIEATLSRDDKERARRLALMAEKFRQAIEADPGYSDAFWGLGDYYESRFVDSHRPDDLQSMKTNYERAYQLDETSAGANAGLGWVRYYEERLDDAYTFFRAAASLSPGDPDVNFNVGSFLSSIGQVESSIRYFSRAIDSGDSSVGPLGPYYRRVRSYLELDRLEEAEDDARKMNVLKPDDVSLRLLYARILAKANKRREAGRELARAEELDPSSPDLPLVRAYLDAAGGDKERALPWLEKARAEDPFVFSYFLAENFARLGMAGEALSVIEDGIREGFAKVHTYLFPYEVLNSPAYASLRSEPRFQAMLASQREKHFAQLEKYRDLCEKGSER